MARRAIAGGPLERPLLERELSPAARWAGKRDMLAAANHVCQRLWRTSRVDDLDRQADQRRQEAQREILLNFTRQSAPVGMQIVLVAKASDDIQSGHGFSTRNQAEAYSTMSWYLCER